MKKILLIILIISFDGTLFGQCDSAYTYYPDLPYNVTILVGDSCLYDADIDVLDSLISVNNLDYNSPLELGTQTWFNGRLKILVAGYYFGGVEEKLNYLPENIGDLDALASLYLEWNDLIELPESLGQLSELNSLYVSNNNLISIPGSIGGLENLYLLDLGYNEINSIPDSICNLQNLTYLWIFNNLLQDLPDCFCDLSIAWDENDPFFLPYFAAGGNMLCENVPECIDTTEHLNISLDQFYYSFQVYLEQDCEGMGIRQETLPESFRVTSAFPNPFNSQIQLKLIVENETKVNIVVYDILGNEVDVISKDKPLSVGSHLIPWESNAQASGIYFIRIDDGKSVTVQQLNLLK